MMWECECGHIEYSEVQPAECGKCFRVSSFVKVPEDMAEEKEEALITKVISKNKSKRKRK